MPDFRVHFSASAGPRSTGEAPFERQRSIVSLPFRPYTGGFQRLSSRALLTTLTELNAIAAPASTGLR